MKKYFVFILTLSTLLFFFGFYNTNYKPAKTEVVQTLKEPKNIEEVEEEVSIKREDERFNKVVSKDFLNKKNETKLIELSTQDVVKAEPSSTEGASKYYKEATVLSLEGSQSYKIELDEPLSNVASVVVVSLDAPVLIEKLSANETFEKKFSKGQEAMRGDWVKLDSIKNSLKSIELETLTASKNRLKVYIQYLGDSESF